MTSSVPRHTLALTQMHPRPLTRRNAFVGTESQLYRTLLFLMFVGSGASSAIPYLALRLAPSVPNWSVDRLPLIVSLLPLIVGTCWYAKYGGFAKSSSLILLTLWLLVSVTWVDPTERGRGLLCAVNFGVTLPLAAVIRRTRSEADCALWFAASYVASLAMAIVTGPEVAGRFGDFVVNGLKVANSNQVGILGVVAVVLMYGVATEQISRRSIADRGARAKSISVPLVLALAALALAVATVSRTAATCLLATFVLIWFRHASRKTAFYFLSPLLITTAAVVIIGSGAGDAWYARLACGDIETLNGRTEIWDGILAISRNSMAEWFRGVGFGGVDKILGAELQTGVIHPEDGIVRLHSHNLYLEWVAEIGFVGLLLAGLTTMRALSTAWNIDRIRGSVYRTSLLVMFACWGMAGVPTKSTAFPALGALLWALLSTNSQTIAELTNGCRRKH